MAVRRHQDTGPPPTALRCAPASATEAHVDEAVELEPPGFSAFIIPDALGQDLCDKILHLLEVIGLDLLMEVRVDSSTTSSLAPLFPLSSRAADLLPYSGGEPTLIVFAADVMPRKPPPGAPHDNRRTLAAQRVTRDLLAEAGSAGVVRMTARSADAWAALRSLKPDAESRLRVQISQNEQDFATDTPLRDITAYGDRAKIEVISWEGRQAVRKTYRKTSLHLLASEVNVMRDLSPLPEIPRLLDHGLNFVVMEHLKGREIVRRRQDQPRPLKLAHVRQLADLLRRCVSMGYDPVDLKPARNVFYRADGLSVFDFEYWRRTTVATPELSYCLAGVPEDDPGDRPVLTKAWCDPYPTGWFPYICLSRYSFLHDPDWLQRIKRPAFILLAYAQWIPRLARRALELISSRQW